ncbi:hypothetical protein SERLA73DRAFT_187558 [Serpula lacrymans var. lacrymans S7.3]|uniref:Nuclear pore complex protein Nup85 n=2 Tax=Serpula lacrymans var. lacrymans TaxID=341189 RepID=F8Q9G3_SERL3|nr:uncharacterized protein SERLADRAFT_477215 [Serpula lacrymans var. lacrymans S7.9]EGN95218.1 hypothetical protein SERLA73DRAFT_187558 [Serpula lacrymans var. lacrymans S7.3]EGO20746.1 hypothetical protein SERLADRAFT_477215 [Serpula lacrymans var. lacrymans S7.9]
MMLRDRLNVVPPLVGAGCADELANAGKTLFGTQSPLNDSIAVAVTSIRSPQSVRRAGSTDADDQPVYFASADMVPSSERRLFISDTSIIYAAFQNLTETASAKGPEWLQSEEGSRMVRKLAMDYVNFTKECWIHASQSSDPSEEELQFSGDHYRCLYTCFSLFTVLYVPEYGFEDAPVGDELMEWLNVHFIEPSTEEGDHLSGLEHPWQDENFWPYLIRVTLRGLSKAATFFFGVLLQHPCDDLQRLSQEIIPLLNSQPRLQDFSAERDFSYASRRWKDKVKTLRIELDRVPEVDRNDGFDNWWDRFSDIVSILEGRGPVVQKICEDLGADWKEVSAAWGVFTDARLRRQDLPDVVAQVLEDMPPDPTNLEDMIYAALFSGDPSKALLHAAQLDPWLAAHLADIMEALSLIERDVNEDSGLTIREYYVLSYAQYLHSDPALWRLTVAYMCSSGRIGLHSADEILIRVPLRLQDKHRIGERDKSVESARTRGLSALLKDVNETCFEYRREDVRRVVCRMAAQTFVQEQEYGLALSYCSSAEDWAGLGRVVDRVLEEYIANGPEQFTRYVADIAPSLQSYRTQPGAHGIFIYRLMFAVRYAEFHQRMLNQEYQDAARDLITMFKEEIVPKSWWGVLLSDSIELLRYSTALLFSHSGAYILLQKLEEVFMRAAQGSGEDYLCMLMRKSNASREKEALDRLKLTRLTLAKYFARCTVIGTGGRPIADQNSSATF